MINIFNEDYESFETRFSTFFQNLKIKSLLASCGINKVKGINAFIVFKFIFTTIFTKVSLHKREKEEIDAPSKNTVVRFLANQKADWNKFIACTVATIKDSFLKPVHEAEDKKNDKTFRSFIVDDSPYSRNKSNKVDLLTKNFDHADQSYFKGFRMLTLGYSEVIHSFLFPVVVCHLITIKML